MAAYWSGGTPPRNTSVSVPRLTPDRKVRTITSSRPRLGQRDRPDLPAAGRAQPERVRVVAAGHHPRMLFRTVTGSSSSGEVRPYQQDAVVGVDGTHHVRHRRAQRAGAVHLLAPGVLVPGAVRARPEAAGRARRAAVDVAPEDHGAGGRATCE